VNEQTAKANKILGYVRRNTLFIKNTAARRALYLALVRAHFGYATQVWSPQSVELKSKLERTERRATKSILNLPFSTAVDYKSRLRSLNLLLVSYWHEHLDLILFFKIIDAFSVTKISKCRQLSSSLVDQPHQTD
jgi:hypothetical protein